MALKCGAKSGSNQEVNDPPSSVLELLMAQDNFGESPTDEGETDFGVELDEFTKSLDEYIGNSDTKTCEVPESEVGNKTHNGAGDDENENGEEDKVGDDQTEIYGCTDPQSLNYNPKATQDDGTCQYDVDVDATEPWPDSTIPSTFDAYRAKGTKKISNKKDGSYKCTSWSEGWAMDLPFKTVPNDGSNGEMKWKWAISKYNKRHYYPEPRPFGIVKRNLRTQFDGPGVTSDIMSDECSAKFGLNLSTSSGRKGQASLNLSKHIAIHWTAGWRYHNHKVRLPYGSVHDHLTRNYPDIKQPWSNFGYNVMIQHDGLISQMQPDFARTIGVGNSSNHDNNTSMNWNMIGGVDYYYTERPTKSDTSGTGWKANGSKRKSKQNHNVYATEWQTPTKAQMEALMNMMDLYIIRYEDIKVFGHHNVSSKACPGFNVGLFLELIGGGYENHVLRDGSGEIYYRTSSLRNGYNKRDEDDEYYHRARDYAAMFKGRKAPKYGDTQSPTAAANTGANGTTSGAAGTKSWEDMDCSEFSTWYKGFQPYPKAAQQYYTSLSLSDPDRASDFIDKVTQCVTD